MARNPQANLHFGTVPLAWLGTAEQFLTCTLRLWYARHRSQPAANWREGFIRIGIDRPASPALDTLLRLPASLLPDRQLDFRPPPCRLLGCGEARVLHCIGSLQRADVTRATHLLGNWLPPAASRFALLPAARLADAMRSVKLVITYNEERVTAHGRPMSAMPAPVSAAYH